MVKHDVNEMRQRLGRRIATLRTQSGLKQAELASAAGISQPHLSQIERGQRGPSYETLHAICAALDVRVSQIFEEPDAPTVATLLGHLAEAVEALNQEVVRLRDARKSTTG